MRSRAAWMMALALAWSVLGTPVPVRAQADYPNKTVTLVVPYPPGGGVDVLARVVAERLSGVLGHQVIVDNRVGGSGLVGTRTVIRSAPDGYTLFLGHTGSISINPVSMPTRLRSAQGLYRDRAVRLDAGRAARASVVRAQDHRRGGRVRKEGGRQAEHRYLGGRHRGYLSAELFKSITGVQATIVPYKGTAQLMNDLLGGHVPMRSACCRRRWAISRPVRSAASPCSTSSGSASCPISRPRMSRAAGFESVLHYGLLGPAGVPRPIVDKLNAAMKSVAMTDEVKKRINNEGGDPLTSTPGGICRRHRSGGAQVGRADQETQSQGGVMRVRPLPRRCSARSLFPAPLSPRTIPPGRSRWWCRSPRAAQRFPGAGGGGADEPHARPAGGGGEPRRGRRRHGRHPRGPRRPRPTATPSCSPTPARSRQPDALSQCRLRSAQGLRADRIDRCAAERADDPSIPADPLDRGAGRLRQGQSQQDQLRIRARHHRPHDHRTVREKRRLRDRPACPTRATAPRSAI